MQEPIARTALTDSDAGRLTVEQDRTHHGTMRKSTATNLHFRVQNISRKGGKRAVAAAAYRTGSRLRGRRLRQGNISVVARAAYRSGERLHDAQIDKTFDFRRKERVDYAAIYTHEYRPAWAIEREPVWNGVEAIERRKDARLAKDITAALPRDLSLKSILRWLRNS
jgi:hypothetical protein